MRITNEWEITDKLTLLHIYIVRTIIYNNLKGSTFSHLTAN
jgi:hypothetical protein